MIHEELKNMSYYDLLGLVKTASAAEIKRAYKARAMMLHPDRNLEKDTTAEFVEIQQAYEVLSNANARARYDANGGHSIDFDFFIDKRKRERPKRVTETSVIKYADIIGSGWGYYADMQRAETRAQGSVEMMTEIDWIAEQAEKFSSGELYALASSLMSLYSRWYRYTSDGEDKKPALEKAVRFIEQAIGLGDESYKHRCRLAFLLAGPHVRNLARARSLAEVLKTGNYKKESKLLLERINQLEGTPEFERICDYSKLTLYPTSHLTILQTTLRALIRTYKKEKNIEAMRPVVDQMYRLAVLYEVASALFYAEDSRKEHIAHIRTATTIIQGMTFGSYGVLTSPYSFGKPYLSSLDYKAMETVYGKSSRTFDVSQFLDDKLLEKIGVVNARLQRLQSLRGATA